MLKIILSRLAQGFLVLIFLYTTTFFLVRWMPEDMFTSDKALSAQALKEKQAEFYLDRPYWEQYKISVGKLFEGDLYKSGVEEQEVTKIISQSFPVSFILGTAGMLNAICIGIPAGEEAMPQLAPDRLMNVDEQVEVSISGIGTLLNPIKDEPSTPKTVGCC